MRRIFMCTPIKFPRENAAANYVEYMALALRDIGYEVHIICIGCENRREQYKGLRIISFQYRKGKAIRVLDYLTLGNRTRDYLIESNLNQEDYVIFYTDNPIYMKTIMRYMKQKKCEGCACAVEWFQPFQYKYGKWDPEYQLIDYCFQKCYTELGNIIAISSLLEHEFKKRGCNATCIPIMTNTREYKCERLEHTKKEFLISGMLGKKDDSYVTFHCFEKLTDEELEGIHINIVGMSKAKFEEYTSDIEDRVLKQMTLHGWMEYNQLIELYQIVDFILIARQNTIVTRANFPSKIPECLTYGIVPIVTRVGDYTSDYLDDTNSIIFESCDNESCAEALRKAMCLTNEQYMKFSANARKLAEEKFDYVNWKLKLKEFIEKERNIESA